MWGSARKCGVLVEERDSGVRNNAAQRIGDFTDNAAEGLLCVQPGTTQRNGRHECQPPKEQGSRRSNGIFQCLSLENREFPRVF
jgi:hypothetical protein